MSAENPAPPSLVKPARNKAADILRLVAATVVCGLMLFVCAGTVAWPVAWVYLCVMSGVMLVYSVIVSRHPDLVAERQKPPADAKRWDKPLVAMIAAIGPIALVLVCGFDKRFHWSRPMSAWWIGAGLLLIVAGSALTAWAVASNRFFSAVVRIQRDRGHRVVDTGPYRLLRHPGYLGSLIYMPGAALFLGSRWALLIVAFVSLAVVVRTVLEDRTLGAELEGYNTYARRVRYRLLPGIW